MKNSPEIIWFYNNATAVKARVDAYVAKYELGAATIGTFRKVSCAEFKKQAPSVVQEYQARVAAKKGLADAAGPLQGQEQLK
jgi:hypothetical protein